MKKNQEKILGNTAFTFIMNWSGGKLRLLFPDEYLKDPLGV